MKKRMGICALFLLTAMLTGGCAMRTVEQMYNVPKRSQSFSHVQSAMDVAMAGLDYAAPISGENQQTVQLADLDGDGVNEYLVFARSESRTHLDVLIFDTDEEENCYLAEVIELNGSAFERVEYVDIDNLPGSELVLGRQVSDQVMGAVCVYSFGTGRAEKILSTNYSHFLTCDLDENRKYELMILRPAASGEVGEGRALALRYEYRQGEMERSMEVPLSASADSVKRVVEGKLQDGAPALFVSSTVGDSAIATDVLAMDEGKLRNLVGAGGSVSALRNYYVYATDIDEDGVMEIPSLITMQSVTARASGESQYLIRWESLNRKGERKEKRYTFHDYAGGWYLQLDPAWATRISAEKEGNTYLFYLWDEDGVDAEALFTLYVLTGSNRDQAAAQEDRFPLYRKEGTAYAAKLHEAAVGYGLTEAYLQSSFHLIHQDWKTGET